MTAAAPEPRDADLLCYCTNLTVGELRRACEQGRWPLEQKVRSGRLCTGCMGDLLYCLGRFGGSSSASAVTD